MTGMKRITGMIRMTGMTEMLVFKPKYWANFFNDIFLFYCFVYLFIALP